MEASAKQIEFMDKLMSQLENAQYPDEFTETKLEVANRIIDQCKQDKAMASAFIDFMKGDYHTPLPGFHSALAPIWDWEEGTRILKSKFED